MAIGTTNVDLAEIQSLFGGTNPISLSEYYNANPNIPSSGTISLADFKSQDKWYISDDSDINNPVNGYNHYVTSSTYDLYSASKLVINRPCRIVFKAISDDDGILFYGIYKNNQVLQTNIGEPTNESNLYTFDFDVGDVVVTVVRRYRYYNGSSYVGYYNYMYMFGSNETNIEQAVDDYFTWSVDQLSSVEEGQAESNNTTSLTTVMTPTVIQNNIDNPSYAFDTE
jgi:hypothetical protein